MKAGIRKGEQRHQIGRLIFQHLEELSDVGLVSVALQFVRDQFSALREEQGHKTFFTFLKYIADSALTCVWDIDDQCTENMAFFIKKYLEYITTRIAWITFKNLRKFLKISSIFQIAGATSGCPITPTGQPFLWTGGVPHRWRSQLR